MQRKPDPERHCAQCGSLLVRKRFKSGLEPYGRFTGRLYCDTKCMGLAMVQEAVTLAGYRDRAKKFRGDRCETCGATKNLHAHHRDEDPANNDPANIATLCGSCHLKWHWANGRKARARAICAICGNPAVGHALCGKHLARKRKHGDPMLTKRNIGGVFVLVRDDHS